MNYLYILTVPVNLMFKYSGPQVYLMRSDCSFIVIISVHIYTTTLYFVYESYCLITLC
jgi:hypothetical protein